MLYRPIIALVLPGIVLADAIFHKPYHYNLYLMLGDLLDHKILIDGSFAKIDVIRYDCGDDQDEDDLLGRKPECREYVDRVWIDTSHIISMYKAGNPRHTMLILSNTYCWEARYKRDLFAEVVFAIRRGQYEQKKQGFIKRAFRYLFG